MREGRLKQILVRGIRFSLDSLQRVPGVRYANLALVQAGKAHSTVFSCTKALDETPGCDFLKQDEAKSLWRDRYEEVRTFYRKSHLGMVLHFLRNGTPNTNYYRMQMMQPFEGRDLQGEGLKKAYQEAAFMYSLRLMLRYHGYGLGMAAEQLLQELHGIAPQDIQVLDYGCGVADPSLYLAARGARATIVDLDDIKFGFARHRFQSRNLPVTGINATETDRPVPLKGPYQVIFLAEFLEHVRDPMAYLKHILAHATPGAIVYDPLGPIHEHGVGGDHLQEAYDCMQRTGYQDFHKARLIPLDSKLGSPLNRNFYEVSA